MEKIDITTNLFNKGFYPIDLPPEFSVINGTKEFCENFTNSLSEFNVIKENKPSNPCQISTPKNRMDRRWLYLPNPLHFLKLADTIAENFEQIKTFCSSTNISASKIEIEEDGRQLFKKGPFNKSIRERISRSSGKKFMLTMDISNFYPSIYTHSLEWIFEGRRLSGKERNDRSYLGVALDKDLRLTQSGKTNGILVGPETSRIISEIIGVYLDTKIVETGIDFSGTRYVDDYHLYFNSLADLERAKTVIQSELNKLNLTTNESKTEVKNVPEIFEDSWVRDLTQFKFKGSDLEVQKQLISVFSYAFKVYDEKAKSPIIKFLLSIIVNKELELNEDSKVLLLELLRHSIELDSRCFSRAFQILSKFDAFGRPEKFESLFKEELNRASELGRTFETLWILHGYNKLNITIPHKVVDNCLKQNDVLSLTLILYMENRSLIEVTAETLVMNHIFNSIKEEKEPFLSEYWLPLYVGHKRKWWANEMEKPDFIQQFETGEVDFLNTTDKDWEDYGMYDYVEMNLEMNGKF